MVSSLISWLKSCLFFMCMLNESKISNCPIFLVSLALSHLLVSWIFLLTVCFHSSFLSFNAFLSVFLSIKFISFSLSLSLSFLLPSLTPSFPGPASLSYRLFSRRQLLPMLCLFGFHVSVWWGVPDEPLLPPTSPLFPPPHPDDKPLNGKPQEEKAWNSWGVLCPFLCNIDTLRSLPILLTIQDALIMS